MDYLLALIIGGLFAVGFYLMMRRSIVKLILGLILLGHAVNLFFFTVSGLTKGAPPLIAEGQTMLTAPFADPLPQALILTALVIGFGVQSFAVVLFRETYQTIKTDDLDKVHTLPTYKNKKKAQKHTAKETA